MKIQSKSIFHILLFTALITSVIGSAVSVTPAHASGNIITVTNTNDDVTPGNGCSLREAIENANNEDAGNTDCGSGSGAGVDTINFNISGAGLHTITVSSILPSISDSAGLTINGGGNVAVSGGGTTTIFHFTSTGNTLENITVTDAFNSFSTGAIYVDAGDALTIQSAAITNNSVGGTGAGVENDSGTVNITGSYFYNNSAGSGSAGQGGAAVYSSNGTTNISNSTFHSNTASPEGGAVSVSGGTTTITNSTFSGNSATSGYGAAVHVGSGTANLYNNILANSITGDDCVNNGGTVNVYSNLIEDSTPACGLSNGVDDNIVGFGPSLGTLTTGTLAYFPLNGNSPAINAGDDSKCAASPVFDLDERGGVRPLGAHCDMGAYEATPTETGPTFAVNTISDTYDGLCDTLGTGSVNKDCSLRDAITAANQQAGANTITVPAGTYELTLTGAAEDENATGDLDINSDMTINGAGASATTIEACATAGSCTDRVMQVEPSITVNINGVTIANGMCVSCLGGGILNYGALNLTNSTLSNNSTSGAQNGGGIDNESGGILTVTGSTFSGNTTNGNGAGIENGSTLTVTSSTFSSNTAFGSLGAGIDNNGTLTITNSTFSSNAASFGGGVMSASGPVIIANSTFWNNTASNDGGGIYNGGGATVTVKNSTFSANNAVTHGSGIYNFTGGTLNMINTILANSTSGADCYDDGGFIGTNVKNLIETNGSVPNDCGTPTVAADPKLATTLALNGGSTQNFALLAGSPALEAGDLATCTTAPVNSTSQNGRSRPQGPKCDIGADEMTVTLSSTIRSVGGSDGWVLESSENSSVGGSVNSTATTLRLGDDATKKQYRSVLSFGTGVLPDNAVITKVTLKLTKQGVVGGGNPVTTFQGFMLDMKKGFFGTTALEKSDFQAAASHTYGPTSPNLVGGAYSFDLTSGASYINKTATSSGLTQIRVRFKLDDNNNAIANYLSLYSGNYPTASVRPALIIQYYVP